MSAKETAGQALSQRVIVGGWSGSAVLGWVFIETVLHVWNIWAESRLTRKGQSGEDLGRWNSKEMKSNCKDPWQEGIEHVHKEWSLEVRCRDCREMLFCSAHRPNLCHTHVLLLSQCMQILKMTLTCIAYVTKCLADFPYEQRDGEFVDVKSSWKILVAITCSDFLILYSFVQNWFSILSSSILRVNQSLKRRKCLQTHSIPFWEEPKSVFNRQTWG